jgi:hypothetical protein
MIGFVDDVIKKTIVELKIVPPIFFILLLLHGEGTKRQLKQRLGGRKTY